MGKNSHFAIQLADYKKNEQMRINQGGVVSGIIIDHYIRHGASVATTMRILDLDKCNWCRQCEVACEERHGVSRFSINGRALGAIGFADCCRTCVDQRCVDACTYDAIVFDRARKEVIIKEDTCTGCSMCAENCPYDAIELHPLVQNSRLTVRLEAKGALKYGPKAPRRLPVYRIAAKCDHCVDFSDQACITHCPTEALVEVRPEELYFQGGEMLLRTPSVPMNAAASALVNPRQFMDGGTLTGHGRRGVARKMRVSWLWAVSLPMILIVTLEIALRHIWPKSSLLAQYLFYVRGEDAATAAYFANRNYHAGGGLSLILGIFGTSLMVSAALYSAFLRWSPLRPTGCPNANRAADEGDGRPIIIEQSRRLFGAFGYHVWAGTIGAVSVTLHTAFTLNSTGSLAGIVSTAAFWLIVAVVLSGLVGRLMSVKGIASVGQAAGKPLVKNGVNLGRVAVEHMVKEGLYPQRVGSLTPPGMTPVDVLIAGSGPAGLSAALSCVEHGLSHVLLESKDGLAATIVRFPEGKMVEAQPYDVRCVGHLPVWDASREALLAEWQRLAAAAGVVVRYQEPVLAVRRLADGYGVRTPQQEYYAARVVLAVGGSDPKRLDVEGEDLVHVRHDLDVARKYRGKSILIVGAGDAAIEAAVALAEPSLQNRVVLCSRTKQITRPSLRNRQALQERVQKGFIHIEYGASPATFLPGVAAQAD
jgi:Fe-S-cluster-containing hydrogenase component 2/thioredoxin reductase